MRNCSGRGVGCCDCVGDWDWVVSVRRSGVVCWIDLCRMLPFEAAHSVW